MRLPFFRFDRSSTARGGASRSAERRDEARRRVLTLGDPSAAISLAPRSFAEKIGQLLRLVMARSPHERLPADMRRLLRRL